MTEMQIKLIQESQAPSQFSLRSLFVATAAIGVALSVLNWLGPFAMILSVQCAAVVAVLVTSRGTAWLGAFVAIWPVATIYLILAFHFLDDNAWLLPYFAFWASLAAWFGGGLAASEAAKGRSIFLRSSLHLQFAWFVIVCVIALNYFVEGLETFD